MTRERLLGWAEKAEFEIQNQNGVYLLHGQRRQQCPEFKEDGGSLVKFMWPCFPSKAERL